MDNNDLIKIGDKIQSRLQRSELLILLLVIASVCLRIFKVPHTGIIITLVFMSAGNIYFFSAFVTPEKDATAFDNFIMKLLGLASSISIIGILFLIQRWPNHKMMITIGLLSLTTCFFYIILKKITFSESEKFNNLILVRIITLGLLSAGLLYFWTN